MKKIKKFFAFVAAVATCLALGATSVNADESTYSVTITNATGTYEIYQVFSGELADDGKTLSNVQWGKDVNAFTYTTKDAAGTEAATSSDNASEIAEYLATKTNDSAVAKDFAEKAIAAVKEGFSSGTATATNGKATFSGLSAGYYVVKNTSVADEETYTRYILQVVGNVTVENKASVPSFEKKVKDTNDSTGVTSDWQDSADYDIGDEVPFQLTGTVASTYDEYKQYYFAFHDVEEAGLTFNEIKSVYVLNGETETKLASTDYSLKTTGLTDGCTFEIVFSNLKNITAVKGGSKIVVEYTSTLNEHAVLGNQGNVNKAKLEFSNNPNEEQSGDTKPGTGETPWDNVIVFTYKTVINKVDADKNALAGAKFELKKVKVDKDGNPTTEVVKTYSYSETAEGTTTFTFKGLDDGTYVLSETETPNGYNTIEDITFTVNADHTITWDGTNRDAVLTSLTGTKVTGEITLTPSTTEGSLTSNVVNKKGTILPSTGGIGTTVFYVTGAILMLGAGVLLVSRKRVSK